MDKKIILIVLGVIVVLFVLSIALYPTISNMQEEQDSSHLTDEEKEYLNESNISDIGKEKVDSNGDGVIDEKDMTREELANKNTPLRTFGD